MRLQFDRRASRDLASLPKQDRQALIDRLQSVAADPFGTHSFVRPIVGDSGLYRLRHGDWRAIYRLVRSDGVMIVEHVAHRREVYR